MLPMWMAHRSFGKRPLSEISREQVIMACEQNYIDYWACAGAHPYAEFTEDYGITRVITGLPNEIFNIVLKCNLSHNYVEKAIDAVIDDLRRRRIPLLWHVGMLTEPRSLGAYLESRGFPHDYNLRAMAIDLDSVRGSSRAPVDVKVETVSNEAQSMHWIECLARSWHLPKEVPEWMISNPCFNLATGAKRGTAMPRRLYLGSLRDEPASACMLFWSEEIAGLQTVGTVPSAQNRGVGMATVKAALLDARAMGFRSVVVLSTVEGERLYEKLGFRKFGNLPEHLIRFDQARQSSRLLECNGI